ncbi:predicted protein [Streptomyces sviceus ATCC 29083]|uniref:Uncharacterized protein n=1 Tax=Streptomyces sviceus (strain ATCC 29083 / DSM 924 / JCM 4929 / NBRC 13980 / NCIMB 11184 / NRRL 5439 / UC 5370) TaxID=463191 RepID=B5I3Q1_STRX2|nr:predicted protein [Streptomyces sviceus ATCC 29083]
MTESSGGPSTFRDLSALVACPRVNSLALSVDGTRLVAAVQSLSGDGTRFVSGLWEIDPTGERDALRLTRSDRGESAPVFGPDGTLYFLSGRAAADGDADEDQGAALWALPPRGEAVVVARHPGGIAAVTVARDSGALCHTAGLLPGAADAEAHGKLRAARQDAKVTAILYDAGPTRAWDHDLGPEEPHTFVRSGTDAEPVVAGGQGVGLEDPGDAALSPDGTRVAYRRFVPGRVPDEHRTAVVVADAVSGEEIHVVGDREHLYEAPRFTHDGSAVVCCRMRYPTYDETLGRDPRPDRPGRRRGAGPAARVRQLARWRGLFTGGRHAVLHVRRARARTRLPPRPGRQRHAAHRVGRVRLADRGPRRADALRPAPRGRRAADARPDRRRRRRPDSGRAARPGSRRRAARHTHRGARGGGRRVRTARLARAARRRVRRATRPAARRRPRRTAVQLERLDLAVEPVAVRRARLCGAAARSSPVDRLRADQPPARLGAVGRPPLHGCDHADRRDRGPQRHRCLTYGARGRLVRRIHGEPGRHQHGPVQGDHQPCGPVGPADVPGRHRCAVVLPADLRRPADPPRAVRGRLAAPGRREDQHPDAGHPRRQGLPRARRAGRHALPGTAAARGPREVPLLPGREPLGPEAEPHTPVVRDVPQLPGPPRPRRRMAAARPAVSEPSRTALGSADLRPRPSGPPRPSHRVAPQPRQPRRPRTLHACTRSHARRHAGRATPGDGCARHRQE